MGGAEGRAHGFGQELDPQPCGPHSHPVLPRAPSCFGVSGHSEILRAPADPFPEDRTNSRHRMNNLWVGRVSQSHKLHPKSPESEPV